MSHFATAPLSRSLDRSVPILGFLRAESKTNEDSQEILRFGSLGSTGKIQKKSSSNPSIVWRIVSMLGISLALWLASSWAVTLRGAQMYRLMRLTYWISPETAWKHSYYIFLIHKEEPGISRNLLDIAWISIIDIIHSAKKICTFCRHHPLEGSSSPTH